MSIIGIAVTVFLVGTMSDMMGGTIEVKLDARVEHLADDLANAVQHMSSSTIDSSTESFDIDIIGMDVGLVDDPQHETTYIRLSKGEAEYSREIHTSENIVIRGNMINNPRRVCFVKDYDPDISSYYIEMKDYPGSECDTEARDIDMRYDFRWGFDDKVRIDGKYDISKDNYFSVMDELPIGRILGAEFYGYSIVEPNENIYFEITPTHSSRFYKQFDLMVPKDDNLDERTKDKNHISFNISVDPLNPKYVKVLYKNIEYDECDVSYDPRKGHEKNCMIRYPDKGVISLNMQPKTSGYWPDITLFNHEAIIRSSQKIYDWGFFGSIDLMEDGVYPNGTIEDIRFSGFKEEEIRNVTIEPTDIDINSFSFDLLVPNFDNDDNYDFSPEAMEGDDRASIFLSVKPFYSGNIDIRIEDKDMLECSRSGPPCYIGLGDSVRIDVPPGEYPIMIIDDSY